VELVPAADATKIADVRAASPVLDKMVVMREELRQMWLNTTVSRDQLILDLQAWCRRAEESGIAALQEFSMKLRAAHV
jgi:stearoyl-CoA desaturase (delta-9 desaturase)